MGRTAEAVKGKIQIVKLECWDSGLQARKRAMRLIGYDPVTKAKPIYPTLNGRITAVLMPEKTLDQHRRSLDGSH